MKPTIGYAAIHILEAHHSGCSSFFSFSFFFLDYSKIVSLSVEVLFGFVLVSVGVGFKSCFVPRTLCPRPSRRRLPALVTRRQRVRARASRARRHRVRHRPFVGRARADARRSG